MGRPASATAPTCALFVIMVMSACGSDAGGQQSAAPTLPDASGEPGAVTEPTTTLYVDTPTTEPPPASIPIDAAPLLGLWRIAAVDSADGTEATTSPTHGYVRVDTPPRLSLSISTFRALDPNDYVCGGGGGALGIDDQMLLITAEYETPAVECLDEIADVPIVEAVAACLRDGCPYVLLDDALRLTVAGEVIELERID